MTPDQLATITIPRSLIPSLMAWTQEQHGNDPDSEPALVHLYGALAMQEDAL